MFRISKTSKVSLITLISLVGLNALFYWVLKICGTNVEEYVKRE
jgi:hypothetical protein